MSGDQPAQGLRYDSPINPGSTYERAARLIASARPPGLVIDLGAGVGSLAQTVAIYGFDAVGFEGDPTNVDAMLSRGRTGHHLDLLESDAVEQIVEWSDAYLNRHDEMAVVAITMLDVIEHLPDPDRSMRLLTDLLEYYTMPESKPLLVLSVPNVAHVDLAGRLLLGRWDVSDVGLLDSTHVTLFTEHRLEALMTAYGFDEIARSDVFEDRSDQYIEDHPVFGNTTLAQFLRAVRGRSDGTGTAYQFVRSFEQRADLRVKIRETKPNGDTSEYPDADRFCSVILHIDHVRPALTDALTSLAAQRDEDFEVLLMVDADEATSGRIADLVASFAATFSERVRVHQMVEKGTAASLNSAIDVACGRYLAVLDDTDLLTGDWISTFRQATQRFPGRTARVGFALQRVEGRPDVPGRRDSFAVVEVSNSEHFDLLDALRGEPCPPCCIAYPLEAVRALGTRFRDSRPGDEHRQFQLDVISFTGVSSDAAVTSVHRCPTDRTGSSDSAALGAIERLIEALDDVPTLLPAGSLGRIYDLYRRIEALEAELGHRPASSVVGPTRQ